MAITISWKRFCTLTVDNTKVGGTGSNHSNFPVLLTEDDLPTEVLDSTSSTAPKSDGADIRFTSDAAGNTELAFEIVHFTQASAPANTSAEIWVKIPSLSQSTNTTIYMWWDNAAASAYAATATYGRNAVWSDYFIVSHDGGPTDSTGNYTLTESGAVGVDTNHLGAASKASDYPSVSTEHYYTNIASTVDLGNQDITLQAWAKKDVTASMWGRMIHLRTLSPDEGVQLIANGDGIDFVFKGHGTTAATGMTKTATNSVWHMVHGVSVPNAGVPAESSLYVNGDSSSTGTSTSTVSTGTAIDRLYIGVRSDVNGEYEGSLAEVRIRLASLSADWITTEYNNQKNDGTFWTAGTPSENYEYEQEGFRFRNDDGSETTATWRAVQDTNAIFLPQANFRLRLITDITNDPPSEGFKIQYRGNGNNPSAWTDLGPDTINVASTPAKLGVSTQNNSTTTSVTGSLSIGAGSNRCLIVCVSGESADPCSANSATATYGGVSMNRIVYQDYNSGSGFDNLGAIFYLNDAGIESASGTTISVSSTDAEDGVGFIAQAYQGVSQTTPTLSDSNFGTANPLTGIALSAGDKDLCIGLAVSGTTSTSATWGGTNGMTKVADGLSMATQWSMSMADRISSASETVNHSLTWGTTPNRAIGMMIKIDGYTSTGPTSEKLCYKNSTNIVDGGANTTTQLTAPTGKGGASFGGGRISDDVNPGSSVNAGNNSYREDEWCIYATTNTSEDDKFDFRLVIDGGAGADTEFATYTVTPQVTIQSVTLKAGSDTLRPKITDATGNAITTARADSLALHLIDTIASSGTMSRSDTLYPKVDMISTILVALSRSDTLSPSIEELTTLFVTLSRSDELKPLITDAYSLFKFIQVAASDTLLPRIIESPSTIRTFLEKLVSDSLLPKIESESYSVSAILWELFDYLQIDMPDEDYTYSEVESLRENDNVNTLFKFPYQMDDYGVVIGDFDTLAASSFGLGWSYATAKDAITQVFPVDTLAIEVVESAVDLLNMFEKTDEISPQITESLVNLLRSSRVDELSLAVAETTLNLIRLSRTDELFPRILETVTLIVTLTRSDELLPRVEELTSILVSLSRNDALSPLFVETFSSAGTMNRPDSLLPLIDDQSTNVLTSSRTDELAPKIDSTIDLLSYLSRQDSLAPRLVEGLTNLVSYLNRTDELLPRIDDVFASFGTIARTDNLILSLEDTVNIASVLLLSDELNVTVDDVLDILSFIVSRYRWRDDDGNETAASWLASENTDVEVDLNTNIRLRIQIDSGGDTGVTLMALQYRKVGDPDWEWRDVE